ncbi:chemotaxis protein CheW [Bacillus suaedaesalsae]|uniref:Purine-binding chemotaxis protein CheW n=1 Tax=Bacillus suaedaesalsae TaxID=2810349 RepID=A0ABS2DIZ8_9BACI|nr:chemotaxis protein CheW [Bacillus suaedaesalsae]MBM6618423.1 purine-binding chemotaxis protein CheW [Bacillus suaedaesalsae]
MSEELTNNLKVIVFQLADEEYGIPVQQVQSIEKVLHITRVPGTAKYVKGVINLRGVVTPIIDLRVRFGLDELPFNDSTRVIIVSLETMDVGLIVDAANDVIDLQSESIEPAPEVIGTVEADYLNGVAKLDRRLLVLLKLEKVLSVKELTEING